MQIALPLTAPSGPGSPAALTGRLDDTGRDLAAEPEHSFPGLRQVWRCPPDGVTSDR
jgi:hypothetical protein